jgi:predicted HD superfamily hydrolase involved in NAD metabolism
MKAEMIQQLMQEMLGHKLYRHSLAVAEEAVSLACRYGADQNKAFTAGMVHDYAKRYSSDLQVTKAEQYGIRLDRITGLERKLLHAPVGAYLIKEELGITDREIISAVAYHTTGSPGMKLLEKIIYLADYIEPGRSFKGVGEIRKASHCNLDQALLLAVENAIKSVLDRNLLLHPRSVAFRNELVEKLTGS